jgi:hypothetical protein
VSCSGRFNPDKLISRLTVWTSEVVWTQPCACLLLVVLDGSHNSSRRLKNHVGPRKTRGLCIAPQLPVFLLDQNVLRSFLMVVDSYIFWTKRRCQVLGTMDRSSLKIDCIDSGISCSSSCHQTNYVIVQETNVTREGWRSCESPRISKTHKTGNVKLAREFSERCTPTEALICEASQWNCARSSVAPRGSFYRDCGHDMAAAYNTEIQPQMCKCGWWKCEWWRSPIP